MTDRETQRQRERDMGDKERAMALLRLQSIEAAFIFSFFFLFATKPPACSISSHSHMFHTIATVTGCLESDPSHNILGYSSQSRNHKSHNRKTTGSPGRLLGPTINLNVPRPLLNVIPPSLSSRISCHLSSAVRLMKA